QPSQYPVAREARISTGGRVSRGVVARGRALVDRRDQLRTARRGMAARLYNLDVVVVVAVARIDAATTDASELLRRHLLDLHRLHPKLVALLFHRLLEPGFAVHDPSVTAYSSDING